MNKNRFKLTTAVHLFLLDGNKILLSRRYNTGYRDGFYSVVAGHLDGNEKARSAMIREAKEEAGIDIDENDIAFAHVMHRKSVEERLDFFFVAEKWKNEIANMEPHKCDDLRWFGMDNLPKNMVPYVKKAISNYKANIEFDQFGWE